MILAINHINDNRKNELIQSIGRRGWIGWSMVLAAAMTLYGFTLAPDIVWQDQGDYQVQAAKCNLSRPGDVVRIHPLFIVVAHGIGRLGWFSYAYAANLTSAIFAALAVANVFLLTYRLTGGIWPGILSAGTFGMAHSVWFLGVQAQTYSMSNAAISGGLLLFLDYLSSGKSKPLLWMGLVFGLGISAHNISQIAFAVIFLWLLNQWLRGQLTRTTLAGIVVAWFIGAGLLWFVAAKEYVRTDDLWGTMLSALWGRWGNAVWNVDKLPMLLKRSGMFFALNFPTPLVLLAILGLFESFRRAEFRRVGWFLLTMTVLYALFSVRYDVPNQNNFFLPTYMIISVYIGLGFAEFSRPCRALWIPVSAVLLAAIPASYPILSDLAEAQQFNLGTRRYIPYRNEYRYYLIPWQQNQTGPRRLVTELFERLPDNAIVLADMTTLAGLQYAHQIEQRRQDLRILTLDMTTDQILSLLSKQSGRLFTLSNIAGYHPRWARDFKPFPLSDSEQIWEIERPKPSENPAEHEPGPTGTMSSITGPYKPLSRSTKMDLIGLEKLDSMGLSRNYYVKFNDGV